MLFLINLQHSAFFTVIISGEWFKKLHVSLIILLFTVIPEDPYVLSLRLKRNICAAPDKFFVQS